MRTPIPSGTIVLSAAFLSALLVVAPALGQYMYLDDSGNGIHDDGDRMNGLNVPTTVEVWLDTAHNRDGTPATCDTQDGPLTINSYQIILHATGGTVQYVSFRTLMFGGPIVSARDSTDFTTLYGSSLYLYPGLYHLGTLVVTAISGTPALQFAETTPLNWSAVTAFGTQCTGNDFDNTYKLGTDWHDTDGLGPVGGPDRAPWVTAPATQTVIEGTPITFTVTALDPDADPIQALTAAPLPPEATFTAASDNASGTFSWRPGYDAAAASPYLVVFTAQNALVGMDTTRITVTNVDRPPEVTAPATIHADENTLVTFQVLASDPDGDPIASLTAVIPEDASFAVAPGNASGTFAWTPGYSVGGGLPVLVRFIARNAAIGQAGTDIYVNNVDRPPTVVAPASQSVDEALSLAFTVSASDPDGQAIGSLSAAPLPPGSTFTPGAGNVTGTFHWTPSLGQAGSYAVTFTASNAMSGSAMTVITVVGGIDHAPVVNAPVNRVVSEGALVSFTVTASDPEGDEILSLTAAPLPSGAVFEPLAGNTSGALSWTPGYTQAGEYSIVFTASNALTGTATSLIAVINANGPPSVTAPASVDGREGSLVTLAVSVSDPEGDAIDSLTAVPLPPGSSFTAGPGNTTGSFAWTPTYAQSGNYLITISAKSACRAEVVSGVVETTCATGTATVEVAVANVDRPPAVTAPAAQSVDEGAALEFEVAASDPDGSALTSLTGAPLPAGAAFVTNAANTSGTFSWTPDFTQAGGYSIIFTASNELSGSSTTVITVGNANRPPIVSAPPEVDANEGETIVFLVSGADPDGDAVMLGVPEVPLGATFVISGGARATFEWVPSFAQSGTYRVTFTASDALGAAATPAVTSIVVAEVNRLPVAVPGGPYYGIINVPVAFDGSASSDPDGDDLSYEWSFGDGASAMEPSPLHAYAIGGSFVVTLTVSDGVLAGAALTSAAIQDVFPARAFTTSSNGTIRLGSGKPTWCVQVEPVNGAYANSSVVPSRIALEYGAVQILAETGKQYVEADRDANGIAELTACFGKADLRALFGALPKGTTSVAVTLEGELVSGGRFLATLTVDVVGTGGAMTATVSPNPFNPDGTLTFMTSREGRVKVAVFDLQGRHVKTLLDEPRLPAGYHDVRIDGLSDAGSRLASGVYFYRIETQEATEAGRFAITR